MTIFQKPNPLLWTAIVAIVVKFIVKTGPVNHFADVILTISLIIWSYMEITKGINWFRKFLGGVVLLWTIFSLYKMIQG